MVKSLYCLPSKVANMNHLTQEKRYTISVMKEEGYSQKDIAKTIKKDKSTVSRELRRSCDQWSGKYSSDLGQCKYNQRQKVEPRVMHRRVAYTPLLQTMGVNLQIMNM